MSLVNPYDQCGILHNELLDYLIAQNSSPTFDQLAEYVADFASTEFDDSTPIFKREIKMMVGTAYNYSQFDATPVGYNLNDLMLNNSYYNGNQLRYLMKILQPTTNPPTVAYWQTIESDVLGSSLTEIEKAPILATLSVAIHSLEYWTAANTDPMNPWYPSHGGSIQVQDTSKADYTVFGIGAAYVAFGWLAVALSGDRWTQENTHKILMTLLISALLGGAASAAATYWP